MEQRIAELEIRYTHLERLYNDLNDVVFEQQKTLDQLTAQTLMLRTRLLSLEAQPENERPPHY